MCHLHLCSEFDPAMPARILDPSSVSTKVLSMPHTGNLDPPFSGICPLCSKQERQLGTEKITKSEVQRALQPKGGSKRAGGQSLIALSGGASQSGAELEDSLLGDR